MTLDDVESRIQAATIALHEYEANHEDGLVAICEQRLDELWAERQRIKDAIPKPRKP